MTGVEVAQFVLATFGVRSPVMAAMAGWKYKATVDHAIKAGFDLVLTKPIDFLHIRSLIDIVNKSKQGLTQLGEYGNGR